MPENVLETISLNNSDMKVQILYSQGETQMTVTIPDFDDELLHADLTIKHPESDDSLNVVIPWNRQTFQFTAKHHSLPTSGYVKIGDKRYNFNEEDCFAVLDYGRGIWPREAVWNWAMASQSCGNHRIAINFGGQWTDGTGMTENALFIDGKMQKIHEDVIFKYNSQDFMQPWHIHTKFTDDVHLTFTPFFEREASTDVKLVKSKVHQMVGYYDGRIRLEDGSIMPIQQLLGTIEEHVAKW